MTSIREQFEAAVEAKFKNVDFALCTAEEGFILCIGEYKQPAVQTMWWAWQASREVIEIELPEKWGEYTEAGSAACDAIDECAEAIKAAGMKVKPC